VGKREPVSLDFRISSRPSTFSTFFDMLEKDEGREKEEESKEDFLLRILPSLDGGV